MCRFKDIKKYIMMYLICIYVYILCGYILHITQKNFHFLSNSMEYDCGDSFRFTFEPNGIQFGSKPRVKLSP